MTFSVEDFHDLLRLLEERPEWRAELRRVVLSEDVLRLPEQLAQARQETDRRFQELAARVEALAEQIAALTERMDALTERMDALTAHVSTLTGHVGSLRGEALEERYRKHAFAYASIIGIDSHALRRGTPPRSVVRTSTWPSGSRRRGSAC